jgi:hypothetical protein
MEEVELLDKDMLGEIIGLVRLRPVVAEVEQEE